ncbi:MAG: SpoIIE family protein phosphatase [Spirochaetales bacterium]|nr:SpoIIE family protein phosphatase [Spirochaetales bacterium]
MKIRILRAALLLLSGFGGELTAQTQTLWWDNPEYLVRSGASFPQTVSSPGWAAVFWQDQRNGERLSQIFLSFASRSTEEKSWLPHRNVLGPFSFTGQEVQIYSAVVDGQGVLWVAVLARDKVIQVFSSSDRGKSFDLRRTFTSQEDLLVPRLFLDALNRPYLVVNEGGSASFRIAAARFDGNFWGELKIITDEPERRLNFLPDLLVEGKTLTMVYQSLLANDRPTYQIYEKSSQDNGITWSPPVRLTDFSEDPAFTANEYDNQRPRIFQFGGKIFVAWERRTRQTLPQITIAIFNSHGKRLDVQTLTGGSYTSGDPDFFDFKNHLYVTWHDNQRDALEQEMSSWSPELGWSDPELLSNLAGNSFFGRPVVLGNEVDIFWQTNLGSLSGIVWLKPLKFVAPPEIQPVNFKENEILNKKNLTFGLKMPEDRSGIEGYNVIWDEDPEGEPEKKVVYPSLVPPPPFTAPGEGAWYLHVIVKDNAGNWSKPATVAVIVKTTPPGPVLVTPPQVDENGWLTSNTFTMSWSPSTPDAKYYAWRLENLAGPGLPPDPVKIQLPPPPLYPQSSDTAVSYDNLENGYYALTVEAFDAAGNRGPAYSYFFRLDKFKPFTRLGYVDATTDLLGRLHLSIGGQGFTSDGVIDRVWLDRDGKPPYDYTLAPGQFHVSSDRLIDGIVLENVKPGIYRVGVQHPVRGILFTGPILKVEPSGTVKIGDFRDLDKSSWTYFNGVRVFFSVTALPVWAIVLLLLVSSIFAGRQVLLYAREMGSMDHHAELIFTDSYYRGPAAPRRTIVRRRGLSLRIKFTASILILTISIIGALATTLGFFITQNSQVSLGEGLRQRVEVLLNGLAASAKTYLPAGNNLELSFLPGQITAMKDAEYATITGRSAENKPGYSYVWASNDPHLAMKIDTPSLVPGVSKIHDNIEKVYKNLQDKIDAQADASVSDLAARIDLLNKKAQPYALRTDAESQRILADYQSQIVRLEKQVNDKLSEIGRYTESLPRFEVDNLLNAPTHYVFYKPIIYRTAGDKNYVKGLVRLSVTTQPILGQITASRNQLVFLTGLVALAALALGLIGAFLLSTITVNPIKKLVRGVETIRDTQDKADLADHVIQIRTRDELADLAETINQMTQGLVAAAEANKDLMLGKDIQKTFIPLDKNPLGRKMTTGFLDLPLFEKFGYYEGAKGVSGDYYGFQQLDNNDGSNPKSPWYGFIKCDVSGKGIPAALIMFNVATLVVKFFRSWTAVRDGQKPVIHDTVAEINDLLESLGYKGRFAALNMGIMNVETGKVWLSHAGDNVIHVWRHAAQRFETRNLDRAPATGQIADFMARSLYKDYTVQLERGDTIFFYTDGIEEAKRYFRGPDWEKIAFTDPNDPTTLTSPSVSGSIDGEDLGPERIETIISAFYQKGQFQLVRRFDPLGSKPLHFDFSTCDASARQAVLALVSVEKVFRLVPDPSATQEDKIRVDVQIDAFLKEHFLEYNEFFHDPVVDPQFNEYVIFSHLKEDDQFDDLTVFTIRRKERE